jgi:hypothetical protein
MPLLSKSELYSVGTQIVELSALKSASYILRKSAHSFSSTEEYDIFLSHSYRDAVLILGLKRLIENLGYTVYVDWIEDTELDRSMVTKATAEILKRRMQNCNCLFFVVSDNASVSKWMPWELGYFDGIKGKVAIMPISDAPGYSDSFHGQEYLGLYSYITKTPDSQQQMRLWVNEDTNTYVILDAWLRGTLPTSR